MWLWHIGLLMLYRPSARSEPCARVECISQSGTKNLATGAFRFPSQCKAEIPTATLLPFTFRYGAYSRPIFTVHDKVACITQWSVNLVLLHNGGFCNNCMHSKTVLAHISAFPNKCTIKHPFHTTTIHEKSGNLRKLHYTVLSGKKQTFWKYYINSEPCMAYYPK